MQGDIMAYATYEDLKKALPIETLIYLTNDSATANMPDKKKTTAALNMAEGKVKMRLGVNYTVPLDSGVTTPESLIGFELTIALYFLYIFKRQHAPDDVRLAYEDTKEELDLLRQALITAGLDTADELTERQDGSTVEIGRS
jgi:phage gp36-like protein